MAFLSRFTASNVRQSEPFPLPKGNAAITNDRAGAEQALADATQQRNLLDAKMRLHRQLIDEINLSAVEKASRPELRTLVAELVRRSALEDRLPVNTGELENLIDELLDEMTGLGPLEPLLKDATITDILINTHETVYVERSGILEQVPVFFKDEQHLLRIINRIVSAIGRRVDESQPMVDARLPDGSRVNVAIRPIAVDGPLVSIRKFSKRAFSLDRLVEVGSLRPAVENRRKPCV